MTAKKEILEALGCCEDMECKAWSRAEGPAKQCDKKTAHGGENHTGISLQGGLKGTKVGCKVSEDLKLKEEQRIMCRES
jgi:hypothetical protein